LNAVSEPQIFAWVIDYLMVSNSCRRRLAT
jgi:hypothetical protein